MGDGLVRDVRHALRGLGKAPLFTVTVVLTLALGIGANTAIFSIADRLLLRPLPFPDGEQIVVLHETRPNAPKMDVSPANWLDWQRDSESFTALAAWTNYVPLTLTGNGEPERLNVDTVSHEFFPLLGVQPMLGRTFIAEDEAPGSRRVVLSYSLWNRRFGADPAVVGQTIRLDEEPAEVIGVMPAGFRFMSRDTDLWSPLALPRDASWREIAGRFIPYVVGRLEPSVTPAAAQAEMAAIADRLGQLHAFNRDTSVNVLPLREALTGQVRGSLLVLLAAVGLLLLIACSNVANLLLTRAAGRRRELAIRTSLGAGQAAIARQLLVESVLLALAGGAAALLVAQWSADALVALVPAELLGVADVALDRRALLYAAGLALSTGALVGLAPVISVARAQVAASLRDGTRSVTSSARLQRALIVAQVAMTVVLLCGATLLTRSLLALNGDPTGVTASNVLTMRVELPPSRYGPAQQTDFFRQAVERLESLPGVESASAGRDIPMSMARVAGTGFRIDGDPELPPDQMPITRVRMVAPGFFETLGIPLVRGREFIYSDPGPDSPPVFLVNEAFARTFLATRNPLDTSMSVLMQRPANPFGTIVGVVGDVKDGSLRGVAEPTVFYSDARLPSPGMTLLIRSERGPELASEAWPSSARWTPTCRSRRFECSRTRSPKPWPATA